MGAPTVNANPCFRIWGSVLYPEGFGDPVRQWDRLEEYDIYWREAYWDGDTEGVTPIVFHKDGEPRGLEFNLSWVNGQMGYTQQNIFLRGGQTYILKIEGESLLFNNGGDNAFLDAEIRYGTGQVIEFDAWEIDRRGYYAAIWVITPDHDVIIDWAFWMHIQWRNVTGRFFLQGARVEKAPNGYEPGVTF